MARIEGEVVATDGDVGRILIEAFTVDEDFAEKLPLPNRTALGGLDIVRLGSALSDEAGRFAIEYEPTGEVTATYKSAEQPSNRSNIWVAASAYGSDGALDFVFQESTPRRAAGNRESYLIVVKGERLQGQSPPRRSAASVTAPAVLIENAESRAEITAIMRKKQRAEQDRRTTLRKRFRDKVAGRLTAAISSVDRDSKGKPTDPNFVESPDRVRTHAEERIRKEVGELYSDKSRKPLKISGRISLTDADLAKLRDVGDVDGNAGTVTVDEEEVQKIFRKNNGASSNGVEAILYRTASLTDVCRELTKGEQCLKTEEHTEEDGEEEEDGGPDEDGEEPPDPDVSEPQPTDRVDRTGSNVTLESLSDDLPRFMAQILNESTPLDVGIDKLPAPGSQRAEDELAARTDFPSMELPPGPADVPAFHDFHDLQIAFQPVWMEVLDRSFVDDAEAAYERYVELGGDEQAIAAAKSWSDVIAGLHLVLAVSSNKPPPTVARHFEISAEEWGVLSQEYRSALELLAEDIDGWYGGLTKTKNEKHDYQDSVNSKDLAAFQNEYRFAEMHIEVLRKQGYRIIKFARAELEDRASSRSPVPTHRVLSALKTRALSQYPAKYFAATRQERSVNFGLMKTYRQIWTPTAYQVGELVKSIPLAPKEVRKYTKKIVRKEKRSRKEIEANLASQKSDIKSTTRSEAEILQKATEKTNFNATVSGSFKIGVYDANGSTTLGADAQKESSAIKKNFHEAVVQAAQEYKNELKVELETEETTESTFEESGEISNPNEEITVTYLFYELQRRYKVTERLHRLTSVVLVAQEMPDPADIDEDWLIAHRWILSRVLLDDGFRQPLAYVATALVGEEHALAEERQALVHQRNLVDELKEDVRVTRVLTESRYSALQASMERTARAAENDDGGGLFGFARSLTGVGQVIDFADRLIGGENEAPEAARLREAATRDAYERELQRLRDLEGRLASAMTALERASSAYTRRISAHLSNLVRVEELKNHVKDNIIHYMQAIWLHEPFDQRWLRLKDVPVPIFERDMRKLVIHDAPLAGALSNMAHFGTRSFRFDTTAAVAAKAEGKLATAPLYQVADLDTLIGFRANYMIFSMKEANVLTDFMMEPFVDRSAKGFGIIDPDDFGNMTLDEFSEYVCCLKKNLSEEAFDAIVDTLKEQLKTLLQNPLRDEEEIVVPLDAMYIEALPSDRPVLENYKLLHRQIDAADAQEDLRLKKMEKIRYAARILAGELDDPDSEAHYLFEGADMATVVPPGGSSDGGGTPPPGGGSS